VLIFFTLHCVFMYIISTKFHKNEAENSILEMDDYSDKIQSLICKSMVCNKYTEIKS